MYLDGYGYDLKFNATTESDISIYKEYKNGKINQLAGSSNLNKIVIDYSIKIPEHNTDECMIL